MAPTSSRRRYRCCIALGVVFGLLLSASAGVAQAAAPAALQAERARLALSRSDIADVVVTDRYVDRDTGVTHLYLRQRHRGLDVIDGTMTLTLARDGSVAAVGDRFVRGLELKARGVTPRKTGAEARSAAAKSLRAGRLAGGAPKPRLVYAKSGAGDVRLAWNVRIAPADGEHLWDAAVDAQSLALLSAADWVADAASYDVFAPPLESPFEGPRTLVSDPADALASPYGWHDTDGAPGAESTLTIGNNVHAATDVDNDSVFDPGSEPDGGAGLLFDFPLDLTQPPSAYRPAAVTNLFFWNNHVHDVAYRYGFTEAAGNFQENNYGRGGEGGDAVQALAQDGAASFSAAPDGFRPRMRMHVAQDFDGPPRTAALQVNSPTAIAGAMTAVPADFGPDSDPGGVTALVALADDGVGVGSDACTALPADSLAGRIALVDRGICTFALKTLNVQAAGAIGEIVVQNSASPPSAMGPAGAPGVTIPAAMISLADGNTLKGALGDGVEVTFSVTTPPPRPDRDSSLDNAVVVHEYTHGISNRLTGGPSTTSCLPSGEPRGMGEGWSDFVALVLTSRATDTATTPRPFGSYSLFRPGGSRDSPYSTELAVDGATYDTLTPAFGEPHFTGWVWATMLWDLHWKLGGDDTALQLVFDGMKIQPCSPGFVDARDAILTADELRNDGQNACAIWQAFARRGLGADALQGDPLNSNDGSPSFAVPSSACAPVAETDRTSIRTTLTPGQTTATALGVRNSAPAAHDDLHWTVFEAATTCANPTDVAWFNVAPTAGTTAPGASSPVAVSLAAANPPPKTAQRALLCIASDDPATPLLALPVELREYTLKKPASPPALNEFKAGSTIAVQFSLAGNWGNAIFPSGSPSSLQINCTSRAPLSSPSPIASTLTYDPTKDLYTLAWKTDKSLRGTCRRLSLAFDDLSPTRTVEVRLS
jgi:extracellular elastinolytic metalloproteinase